MTRRAHPDARRWTLHLVVMVTASMLPLGVFALWQVRQAQTLGTHSDGFRLASMGDQALSHALPSVDWMPFAMLAAAWLAAVGSTCLAAHWVLKRRLDATYAMADVQALRIAQADHVHTADLAERTTLLREVHHRVKNNLQLVASIMNMHARVVQTTEAQRLLSQLQRRVRGLATVHQTLSASSQLTSVDSRELFDSLVRDMQAFDSRKISVAVDMVSVQMSADQAVALSMLASEALANAARHAAAAPGASAQIAVAMQPLGDGQMCLSVRNSKAAKPAVSRDGTAPTVGLGQRLMQALVLQLDGQSDIVETVEAYDFRVSFPLADVANAAHRPTSSHTPSSAAH
ncbi:MAG: sensor histidine kinase [Pseudomonadota bacterium]